MSQPAAPGAPPDDRPGPLARYHAAMPELAALLDAAGMSIGPDRWQNLYDLLLALAAQGRLPDDSAALEPLIEPLLCRSQREQGQLRAIVGRWLDGLRPALPAAVADRPATQAAAAPAPVPPGPRLRWWLLALVLVFAGITGGFYWYHWANQPLPPPPDQQVVPSPGPVEPPPMRSTAVLQPLPPRRPLPQPVLDPVHRSWLQTLADLCLFLPGFLAAAWLLLRWLTWRTVLERRQGHPHDPLTAIGIAAQADTLLDAPSLRAALRRLHHAVSVPTRRLDADATVERTARRAGLFQPVTRQRRRVPDLVVLVEIQHAGDQMAGLAGQLSERLRDAGLTLHRYDWRGNPRRVVDAAGRWRTLEDCLAHHEGARLLLIGEPAAFIDPESGAPKAWTRAFAAWPRRGLLTTRRPPPAWAQALTAAGFLVAEIGSAGLQTLALHLAGQPAPAAAPTVPLPRASIVAPAISGPSPTGGRGFSRWRFPIGPRKRSDTCTPDRLKPRPPVVGTTIEALPRLLQDAWRWSQPVAPPRAERELLLAALDDYLGEEGAALLAAIAAYPQLHWGLTRVLDLRLFPGNGADRAEREARLLKVARLPWCRQGWLPDWLRAALLARRSRRDLRTLRHIYRELMHQATTRGPGRIALPVALPVAPGFRAGLRHWWRHRDWRLSRWLRGLAVLADGQGALKDSVFADVLFGWRPRLPDSFVPRGLLRPDLSGALGRALAPRIVAALVLALAGAWGADQGWHRWLEPSVVPWLLAQQTAAHRDYRVEIHHRPETAALAQALRATLQADGFTRVEIAAQPLVLPAGTEPPRVWVNRIQWGDEADVPTAAQIEERLTYLTWGHDPDLTNRPGVWGQDPALAISPASKVLRVLLATPGATGTGFRDGVERSLTPEQIAGLLKAPPADDQPGESDAVKALRTQIASLEAEWQRLQAQRQSELTGADGRTAGDGPKARALDAQIATARTRLDDLGRQLRAALGEPVEPPRVFRDPLKDGGQGPEMVRRPGGTFLMGSPKDEPERGSDEGPQHQVTVPPFAIGRTEVTFADYDRFAAATKRNQPADNGWGRGDRPVINVTWNDAKAYADWLSAQTGQAYRLPSESEWEYAARGGTTTPFWTGACIHTDQANYDGNVDYNGCGAKTGLYRQQTVPAGDLPANAFGLNEVAGNVWEWAADCWHDNYQGAPADGSAWLEANGGTCARRVLRGGSWLNFPRNLRAAFRYRDTADNGSVVVGFRLARTF